MPLSINVGLSRKASRDYQSHGVSINVTAELDSALLGKPDDLQKQIDDLYLQADTAMQRQAGNMETPQARRQSGPSPRSNGRNNGNNGGGGNGNGSNRSNAGFITASQRRAILAIADRANINLEQELHDIVGTVLDDMSIRQASDFIDHLKRISSAQSGN